MKTKGKSNLKKLELDDYSQEVQLTSSNGGRLIRHNLMDRDLDMSIFETNAIVNTMKENIEKNLLDVFYETETETETEGNKKKNDSWVDVQYCSKMSKESLEKLKQKRSKRNKRRTKQNVFCDNFDTFNANGKNFFECNGSLLRNKTMNIDDIEIDKSSQKFKSGKENNHNFYQLEEFSEGVSSKGKSKLDEEVEKSLRVLKSMTQDFQDQNRIINFLRKESLKLGEESLNEYERHLREIVESRKQKVKRKQKIGRKYSSNVIDEVNKENQRGNFRGRKTESVRRKKMRSSSRKSKHSSGDVVGKVKRFEC